MHRFVFAFLLVLSTFLTSQAAPTPPLNPASTKIDRSPEEIKKAIQDLSSPRFPVRERASKFLWEAGSAAEKALEVAERSKDEETASRAKGILEKFRWGMYPDTPEQVRQLIEKFRDGESAQRMEALRSLLELDPIPFSVLRKLISREENADAREQMFVSISSNIRKIIPFLLLHGNLAAAEDLLEIAVAGSPTVAGADYAAFMLLRGKLDESIARFEIDFKKMGKTRVKAATMLVFLYRVKGDWPAAIRAVQETDDRELTEMLFWEASDWKGLSELPGGPIDAGNRLGTMVAYARLAGDNVKRDTLIESIRKTALDENTTGFELRQAIDALLLNGKPNLAIEVITERKRELALGFDLLCAQMKYKEGFALVEEARQKDTDPKERQHIEIRRAKMLYQLGEKDAARQLFGNVVNNFEFKERDDLRLMLNLIKAEVRLGMSDLAVEHAGKCLAGFIKAEGGDHFQRLTEPIFGDENNLLAYTWWNLMRQKEPEEDAGVTLKRIRALMSGKLEPKLMADWIEKMQNNAKGGAQAEEDAAVFSSYVSLWAIAQVYRASQNDKKAEEYLKRSAEASNLPLGWIRYGDFLMEKKRYPEAAASYAQSVELAERLVRNQSKSPKKAKPELFDPTKEYSSDNFDSPALATYLQGRALKLAGNEKEGNRLMAIAHWLPLGDEEARADLIDELNKRDWPEMAHKEAHMVLKTGWYKNYTIGNVISLLARESAKEKHFEQAARYYDRCLVGCLRTGATFVEPTAYLIVPESVRIHQARGLLSAGKIKEALELARQDLDITPGNVDVAIKMVPEMEKRGMKKEADELYTRVKTAYVKLIKEYPQSAFGHNSLAWILANCNRDLDDALKYSQRAVELEPKSAGYLDTLAEVHFRKGNRAKALELMKKCHEMDKSNAYYRKQLERFKNQPFDSPTPEEEDD